MIARLLLICLLFGVANAAPPRYDNWLNGDAAYIITNEERIVFNALRTDQERQQFVEQFWKRRDPTPDSMENEFKEEHYRRIAYANERYGSSSQGWKTDRGRIYITFGPPDETESHASGGGSNSTYPFERWRYRYLEGIGNNVEIEVADTTLSGNYKMAVDQSEKSVLFSASNAVPAFENGLSKVPKVRFSELEAVVNIGIRYNALPMKTRTDFFKLTGFTVLSNVSLLFDLKDLQFKRNENVSEATVNVYGRVVTLSRRVVEVFEDVVHVEVQNGAPQSSSSKTRAYQKSIPLAPGSYRLSIVCKDVVSGNMTNYETSLNVPQYEDGTLSGSSLILAGLIENAPTQGVGAGQFIIGGTRVHPRMTDAFERDEMLGVYAQFYDFAPSQKSKKPKGSIQYRIVKNGSEKALLDVTDDVGTFAGASARQVTVRRLLPLQGLEPGFYSLRMRVTDRTTGRVLTPTAKFTIRP